LGDAQSSAIEPGDGFLDRLAQRLGSARRTDSRPSFPGGLNRVLGAHNEPAKRIMRSIASTHCASGGTSAMRTWFAPGLPLPVVLAKKLPGSTSTLYWACRRRANSASSIGGRIHREKPPAGLSGAIGPA